jgi:hypothetical protein
MISPYDNPRLTGMPLRIEYIDSRRYRLLRDVSYTIEHGPFAGAVSTVRTGFTFDYASIPRIFWPWLPPAGNRRNQYGIASLWHDWLYVHQTIAGQPCRRKDADAVFLEIMRAVGVSPILAQTLYIGVRIGGWVGWRRNRKRKEQA